MASSMYAPLQRDSREFRLLVLRPSADRLAPIRCLLNRASFDKGKRIYTALSYVWGNPLETKPIFVNGVETQVTTNLEAALRHIREEICVKVLWVDALCINQKDEAEKNQQVGMMGEIYSGAKLVIAWLGSAGEDSDLAMEVLGRGWDDWVAADGLGDWLFDDEKKNRNAKAREKDLGREAMEVLQILSPQTLVDLGVIGSLSEIEDDHQDEAPVMDHSGIASHNQHSGSSDSEINEIKELFSETHNLTTREASAVNRFLSHLDGEHQDEAPTMDYSDTESHSQRSGSSDSKEDGSNYPKELRSDTQRLTTSEASAIRRLLTRSWWSRIWIVQEALLAKNLLFKCGDAELFRDKMSRERLTWMTFFMMAVRSDDDVLNDQAVHALGLLEALHDSTARMNTAIDYLSKYGNREATNPRDHIYGLLGVIPTEDRMLLGEPDYGCRVEDLFINVTTRLMEAHGSMELLRKTGIPPPATATTSTKINLPSWVPDWTRTRPINHGDLDGYLLTLPNCSFHFQFSEDAKELELEGFKFDRIESVKPVPTYGQEKIPLWQDDLTIKECAAERGLPALQLLIVALLLEFSSLERLDNLNKMGFVWVECFFLELEECYELPDDSHENYDYLAGFLEWIGETRDKRTDEEILEKIFSVEAARAFVEWHDDRNKRIQRWWQIHPIYTSHRRGALGHAGYSMFRTDKGFFGMTQAAAAAGDFLCVVPSCRVMLVFRQTQSSKYLVVGPSSPIAGALHEIPQAIKRGEITREFFTLV